MLRKRNSHFFLILILIALFLRCTREINSFFIGNDVVIHVKDRLLKVRDSTFVHADIPEHVNSNFVIQWSTNIGKIEGEGKTVIFIAPAMKGQAIIKAEITNKYNHVHARSEEILIYKQLIFLKADDFIFDASNIISPRWISFVNFIKSRRIKASLGLIGNSLEKGNAAYFLYLKMLDDSGYFEIWNHGYNHILNGMNQNGEKFHEFWNTSYDYQKTHLLKTQYLAKEKIGITLHTFGAPGNAWDNNTLKAIEDIDEIKVWYFGPESYSKLSLKRLAEIEFPTTHPDFQKFKDNYNAQEDYLALQVHPRAWDENEFSEFKKIVNFLIQNDVTFITPYEYYQLIN